MTQISLISEQWIPVRDRKGVVRKISPLEILDEEIVDIAAERQAQRAILIKKSNRTLINF